MCVLYSRYINNANKIEEYGSATLKKIKCQKLISSMNLTRYIFDFFCIRFYFNCQPFKSKNTLLDNDSTNESWHKSQSSEKYLGKIMWCASLYEHTSRQVKPSIQTYFISISVSLSTQLSFYTFSPILGGIVQTFFWSERFTKLH